MRNLLLIFSLFFLMTACNQGLSSESEKSVEEIMADTKISASAEMIRNPVSATEPEDTVNVAKMVFSETEYDFGEVVEGEVVTHTFTFVNKGRVPLVISRARSTCGCTVPEWPKDPVPAGEEGVISVKFNTAGKRGNQVKPINITANTYPSLTRVDLKGKVRPKDPRVQ